MDSRRTSGRFSSSWVSPWCRVHPQRGCPPRAPRGDGREKRAELVLGQEHSLSAAPWAAVCVRAGMSCCSTEPPALLCASWAAASCAAQHPGSPGGELWQLVKKAPEKKNVRKAMQKFIFYFNSKI